MDRSIAETLGLSEVGVILVLVVIAIVLAVITRLVTASRAKKAAQEGIFFSRPGIHWIALALWLAFFVFLFL